MGPVTARRPGIADCLTLGNAMCGLAAIVAVTGLGPFAAAEPADRYRVAALLVIAGTVLDMVDGMAARRWGGTPLGPLLDGLADGVTFGVAPVVAVLAVPRTATSAEWATLAAGGGVYAIAALVRLADYAATRSAERGFRGLPTTSASIAALALGVLTTSPTVLAIGLAVLGALMLELDGVPGRCPVRRVPAPGLGRRRLRTLRSGRRPSLRGARPGRPLPGGAAQYAGTRGIFDGSPPMMLVTLRDMQWRARRIVIGLAATSLVLAIAALLGALHDGFLDETDRTIAFFGGDTWVIPAGVSGPFTSNSPMPQAWADRLRGEAGPQTVTPVAIFRHAIQGRGDGLTDVNVIAYAPNGVVVPHIEQGRSPTAPGEAAVDVQLGAALGDVITLAGRQLVVVGEVRGLTYNGGTPTVLITL